MNPSVTGGLYIIKASFSIESIGGKALETEMTKVKVITDSKESRLKQCGAFGIRFVFFA